MMIMRSDEYEQIDAWCSYDEQAPGAGEMAEDECFALSSASTHSKLYAVLGDLGVEYDELEGRKLTDGIDFWIVTSCERSR